MKLIVPYTAKIRPVVSETLVKLYKLNPIFEYVGNGDFEYYHLLKRMWLEHEDFVIVEHDVLPWPGAVEELFQCPYNWCSLGYKINVTSTGRAGYGAYHTFGCAKFSTGLMDAMPKVWDSFESRHWSHLDAQFATHATAICQSPHPHRPPAIHLHE